MPGPLDAFERIDTLPGNPLPPIAQPPPPSGPPTGFFDNLRAGFTGTQLTGRSVSEMDIVRDGYKPILDELNRDRHGGVFTEGSALGRLTGSEDTRFDNPGMIRDMAPLIGGDSDRERAEARIFAEIHRRRQTQPDFLKGVPDSPDEFRAQIYARASAQAVELERIQSRATFGGRIGGFVGGAGGYMTDPLAIATLPVGGFGRTVARRVLTEGLTQAGVATLQQPGVAEVHAKLGLDYTAADAAFNIAAAGAGGILFRGLAESGGAGFRAMGQRARSAFPDWARQRDADAFGRAMQRAVDLGSFADHELPSVAARMMSPDFGILSADAARAQLRREIEAGTIDDRAVAEHFRLAVPEENRTPDEKAALAGIGYDADLAEASPYRPSPEGDLAHQANFAAAVRRILDGAPHPSAAADVPAGASVPRGAPPKPAVVMAPNDVVRFVINDLEGGAKVVHYNHADGGTTKYGIAQADHPGVDVANLTEDQAAAIARRKYWLPEFYQARPDVAAIAFDAHYIHGDPAFARRLAAMDDPAQALRAYRAKLNEIADTVPGKAKYKKGWNTRVDRLGRRLGIEDAPFAPPELRPAFAPYEPGVEIIDRESLAAAATPDEDPASAVSRQVREALAASRPVMIEDMFGSRRIVDVREEGLIDEHGIAARPQDIVAPTGDAPARVLLGPEPVPAIEVASKAAPAPRRGPVHLLQAIADAGGLRDDEGHDLIKGRGIPKYVLGAGTIVRRESGLSVDAMGEHLWEQGWFGPHSTTPRPSEAQVLDLLEQGVKRKLYRPEDQAAVDARAAARAAGPEEDDARFELASHAEEHGLHLDDRTLDEALAHRAAGETVEGAVSRAVHDAAYRDARGAATLDRLDEEEASGWKGQVESIEHDLRMDAGGDGEKITVYHGSPHKFDRFSLDHVGTGEGNQAFGHGLYFAGNKAVAETYRLLNDDLKIDGRELTFDEWGAYNQFAESHDIDKALADNGEMLKGDPSRLSSYHERQRILERWKAAPPKFEVGGHLYEVEIPSGPYLLWDKPLSEQPEEVRAAMEGVLATRRGLPEKFLQERSAGEIYRSLNGAAAKPGGKFFANASGVSDALREAGIAGIKYLDGGSRDAGDGSFNYVVFDDASIGYRVSDGGGDKSASEILADLDREQAGADALRACMVPGGGQ